MRAYVPDYELVAPPDLRSALETLAREPGVWRPIAGGTDLLVLFGAGKLPFHKLLSIWKLDELRGIDVTQESITIGALTSYTQILQHPILQREFPLLTKAASWTGGVATQNRGTLAGNIANASPAADSPPALLVYGAELELVSSSGSRSIPYNDFHTGYKQTQMRPDELIASIRLPRSSRKWHHFTRKVGTRKAQAISKVCVAAIAELDGIAFKEVRIALGSVAPTVIRCPQTEAFLTGKSIDNETIAAAKETIVSEIRPITDIRSTADYRLRVTANIVEQFLLWTKFHACCGSNRWADAMTGGAQDPWWNLEEKDWLEAFAAHSKIGEKPANDATAAQEQKSVGGASPEILAALAEGNRIYFEKFGYIYIVCATGKSGEEMLAMLRERLFNDPASEIRIAAEEQRKITTLRLEKFSA
jgi:OHCU decarboxylase